MPRKNARKPCTVPGCDKLAKGREMCQHHYDIWMGKIRRERDKQRNKEKPFLKFTNPYRKDSGYHIVFEVIRANKRLTQEQIIRRSRIELAKAGKADYRIDYALEVLKAKKHSSKKGDYQVRIDNKGRWNLIKERRNES